MNDSSKGELVFPARLGNKASTDVRAVVAATGPAKVQDSLISLH
jgi:hypothetical protein